MGRKTDRLDKTVIVLVERPRPIRTPHASFADALGKRYHVISVPSGKQAIDAAHQYTPLAIIVDTLSLHTTGGRMIKALKLGAPGVPLIYLGDATQASRDHAGNADIVLQMPFTARKLHNVLDRLRAPQMMIEDDVIRCGPFILSRTRRILSTHGQEKQLTPKVMRLLEFFFDHCGETLDRKTLMEQIWQTDYLGDTRTLNVHIRWIRNAIEIDPGHPQYLKTVRGIGYCFDLPDTLRTTVRREEVAVPIV